MTKRLSDEQIERYARDGYVSPVPVMSAEEAAGYRADLERCEAAIGRRMTFPEISKAYLLFDWADRLVRHPAVLDAVEDLIGPDILAYHSTTWIKEANTPSYVLWHQDGKYFHLDPPLQVTAWVALSDAPLESGCVHVLPGSHEWGEFAHEDDPGEHNMIKRGQGIRGRFDDESGVAMPLRAGEMSLHHTRLVHCSRGNMRGERRIGLGISYIPASVNQHGSPKATAMPVRGRARPGAFDPDERLLEEMSDAAWAAHKRAVDIFRARQDIGSTVAGKRRFG